MKYKYREFNNEKIKGQSFTVIVNNFNFYLAELTVYANKKIECWGLMDLDEFYQKLDSGWIRIDLPKNSTLHIDNFGHLKSDEFVQQKTKEDFLKEIEDAITELNGGKGRVSKCIDSFKNYLLNDDLNNFEILKSDFENLPSHRKVLFEYVDYKDPLIELMKTENTFTKEQRRFMLNDYFEGEWDEKKLK